MRSNAEKREERRRGARDKKTSRSRMPEDDFIGLASYRGGLAQLRVTRYRRECSGEALESRARAPRMQNKNFRYRKGNIVFIHRR